MEKVWKFACGCLLCFAFVDQISCSVSCFQGDLAVLNSNPSLPTCTSDRCYEIRNRVESTPYAELEFGCGPVPLHKIRDATLVDHRTCTGNLCNKKYSDELREDLPEMLICAYGNWDLNPGSRKSVYCHKNDKCARIVKKRVDGSIESEYSSCSMECRAQNIQCKFICNSRECNTAHPQPHGGHGKKGLLGKHDAKHGHGRQTAHEGHGKQTAHEGHGKQTAQDGWQREHDVQSSKSGEASPTLPTRRVAAVLAAAAVVTACFEI